MKLDMLTRSRTDSPATRPDERKLVRFTVADVRCAIDIMHVREILQPGDLTSLPGAGGAVIGVANHRNAAIPVVDLRQRLGLPERREGRGRWIVAASRRSLFILLVDTVEGVSSVNRKQLRDRASLGDTTDFTWALSVYGTDDGLLFELDPDAIHTASGRADGEPREER